MRRLSYPVGLVAGVVAAAIFLYLIRHILLIFIVPAILAYLCAPLIDWLARGARLPRWVPALGVYLVLTGTGALLGWLIATQLSKGAVPSPGELQASLSGLLETVLGKGGIELFGRMLTPAQIASQASSVVQTWLQGDARLPEILAAGVAGLFAAVLSWVLLAYFLFGGPQIAQGMFQLVVPEHRQLVARVCRDLDPIVRRYFLGVLIVVVYASCAAYVGLGLLLGLRHAALLACLTGLLETVPIVGPVASALIGGVAAFREAAGTGAILGYVAYAFALRISIDQLVGPLVLGGAARVSPVLVIFCFLSGGILYGIAGVILGVPVALAVRTTLAVLYEERDVDAL